MNHCFPCLWYPEMLQVNWLRRGNQYELLCVVTFGAGEGRWGAGGGGRRWGKRGWSTLEAIAKVMPISGKL